MENRFIGFVQRLSTAELNELKDAIKIVVENGEKSRKTGCEVKEDENSDYPMWNDNSSMY